MNYIIYEIASGWCGVRDGAFKFRRHFKVKEFACHDGSDFIKVSSKTLDCLEDFRVALGLPVIITSAYRTLYYNRVKVKSADTSQHVRGRAVDIDFTDAMKKRYSSKEVVDLAISCGFTGVGYYDYYDDQGNHVNFFHLDTRVVDDVVYWEELK